MVSSILRRFPEDVAARLEGTAPPLRSVVVPLIEDVTDDGTVVYKEHPDPGPPGLSGLSDAARRAQAMRWAPGVVGTMRKRAGTEMGESARVMSSTARYSASQLDAVSVLRTQPRLVPSA